MALSVISAVPRAPNVVRVTFNMALQENSAFYEKSNYSFSVRFGRIVLIYAKEIQKVNTSTVDVVLTDAMLEDGKYLCRVLNVVDSLGGAIDTNANTAQFDGVGEPLKCFDIRRHMPEWYDSNYGSNLHALLCATGTLNDELVGEVQTSALNEVRAATILRLATSNDLSIIGQNYGVTRPDFVAADDTTFRKLIPILGTRRKATMQSVHSAIEAIYGPRATVGWNVYEITPNKFIIEIPDDVFFDVSGASDLTATYLPDIGDTIADVGGDYFLDDVTEAGTLIDERVVVVFYVATVESVMSLIKASGIVYEVVTTASL